MTTIEETQMIYIYANPTEIDAREGGDDELADNPEACAELDRKARAKAKADGHYLTILPESEWAEDRKINHIGDDEWATWTDVYGFDEWYG